MMGERIKQLREERNLNQAELADKANISSEYISELEHNKRPHVSCDIIYRIAKALGVPVSMIVGDIDLDKFQHLKEVTGTEIFLEMLRLFKKDTIG